MEVQVEVQERCRWRCTGGAGEVQGRCRGDAGEVQARWRCRGGAGEAPTLTSSSVPEGSTFTTVNRRRPLHLARVQVQEQVQVQDKEQVHEQEQEQEQVQEQVQVQVQVQEQVQVQHLADEGDGLVAHGVGVTDVRLNK